MIENTAVVRRKHVERQNGFIATWWHYSRWTILVATNIVAWTLYSNMALRAEKTEIAAAFRQYAAQPIDTVMCWDKPHSTSLMIVGGSREQVDEGLLQAAHMADNIRMAIRNKKEFVQ